MRYAQSIKKACRALFEHCAQKANAFRRKRPRVVFGLFLLSLAGSTVVLFFKATTLPLPSSSRPIIFFSNQTRQDLKLLFCQAIQSAHHSLDLSFYGITDKDILALLSKKAQRGVKVSIEYDRKASSALSKKRLQHVELLPRSYKGLMHKKALVIDHHTVFLGSANLTVSSLRHHSNFVLGLFSPELARYIYESSPQDSPLILHLNQQLAEYWEFPQAGPKGLKRLLELICHAQSSIRIAIFTFTHPDIVQALIKALSRNVKVSVVIDHYSGKGASKQAVQQLIQAGAEVLFSQGQRLLHHKWAIFDQNIFVIGSANWTKAAFSKNSDFLLILNPLTIDQKKMLNKLWSILELESNVNDSCT